MTSHPRRLLASVCLASLSCLAQPPVAFPNDVAPRPHVAATTAELPMAFEPNVGQTDERVAFLSRGSGLGAFLTADALVLSLRRSAPADRYETTQDGPGSEAMKVPAEPLAPAVLRMRLSGASPSTPVGEEELEAKTNYFLGNDPDRWHTNVPNFARVRYPNVYPGVDLVYYGRGGRLEYDLVVAPGADPSAVVVEWEGADSIEVDPTGALAMKVGDVELRQLPAALYQEDGGGRRPVTGALRRLGGGRFGVEVGDYDRSRPLVVDPILAYSTFLGGIDADSARDVAVDPSGAVYVTGTTSSSDFPTYLGYDSTFNGDYSDTFVTKLSPAGGVLVYSTYLGGSGDEFAEALAVDSSGNVYTVGQTYSDDFPTIRSYDNVRNGGDLYVTRINPLGDALVYSTYFGGDSQDSPDGIAVDSSGGAYITGGTSSDGLATANGYDPSRNGVIDAFVAKLKPFSPFAPPYHVELEYCTYFGGSSYDWGEAIAVDSTGAAVVVGYTESADLPPGIAYGDHSYNGAGDAFVMKLSPAGNALKFSTYLGGSGYDAFPDVAIDAAGNVYAAGKTESIDFPTSGGFDSSHNGGDSDVFVTKFRRSPSPLQPYLIEYSSFLGGSGYESVPSLAVDSSGAVYIAGNTGSTDFPTRNAYDASYNGGSDFFVTKLRPAGNGLLYSTYLGGSAFEYKASLAIDSSGAAYVVGQTSSSDFPAASAYDDTFNGATDAFLAKLQ